MKKLLFTTYILTAFILTGFTSCHQAEPEKPNILFIFADDQSFNTVNATGNNEIITPNLDKLVNEGVSLTQSYNMGGWNGAVCVASRTMLNTGRTVWRAHQFSNSLKKEPKNNESWGQLMKSAGYETYMTGKWHIKLDAPECFDHVAHERPGMPNQTPEGYNRPLSENDTNWAPWKKEFDGFWKGGKHWSEVVADDAITFLDDASAKDKPFFMYLAFNAPHDPRQSPKEFVDKYPLDGISVPVNFQPRYPNDSLIGCGPDLRDARLAPFPRTEYAVKVNRQEYYAIITHMDQQIGRIIEHLKATGQDKNTYIVFSADHGLACGYHGLIGKQNMYEHSMRVPLFIVGPNLEPGKKVNAEVYLQDIMPTTLELAGVEQPEYVEFNSFLDLVKGNQSESYYDEIYGCYIDLQRMIRKDGKKLIVYPKIPEIKLFDLEKDPQEMNNLANEPEYQELKKKLFDDLVQLQKEMGDKLELSYVE